MISSSKSFFSFASSRLDKIQKDGKCVPVTHFTCIGNTREGIKEQLENYLSHGINHMLALRCSSTPPAPHSFSMPTSVLGGKTSKEKADLF